MVKVIKHESPLVAKDLAQDAPALETGVALDSLKPGQGGTILRIEAAPALKLHLMELGFVAGSSIAFLMSTPFGDPNIYALRGTSIALRKSEAQCIRVRT
jgi:ferrous iron transport protein A